VEIDPETEAIVTTGSKEGLAHLILMLARLERGDTVLVPDPSYAIHIYGAVISGADIRSVPLTRDVDFFAELEKAIRGSYPKPKMMVLGFPSNPTARAGAKDVAVEFFTLSKSYNMAGWRIGFMVGNPDLVRALARIKSYHDYGMFTPVQVAAIAALEGDQQCVHDIAAQYQRRRDALVKGLHEAGWMVELPRAPMYVWARIPDAYAALGSLGFAKHMLEKAKVSLSPGIGFGDNGEGYVRFALIENEARTRQAVRAIKSMFSADGLLKTR
jgi:alanine-synthesizing transaminase